jgi:hypothetical protein
MLLKILGLGASGLLSLTLLGMMPSSPQGPDEPPPPKKKELKHAKKKEEAEKKADEGPAGDLHRAYSLLRRLRSDGQASSRPEARIRDWTDRATKFYRAGVQALKDENPELAHEYGAISHELARAIEHARNATLNDQPDEDLPPPPGKTGSGRDQEARRDLARAYERLREGDDGSDAGSEAKFFRDAANDLYRAARRDFDARRTDRAGELARAAEAMTHVVEHLGHAADVRIAPPPNVEPKERRGRRKADSKDDRGEILPPPPCP